MSNTINAVNPKIDQTVRIFDQFYAFEAFVPVAEYDAIYGYFTAVMGTGEAATNFTTTVFRIAQEAQVSPMLVFDNIKGKTGLELTATLAYYLNGFQSLSTLLGVDAIATPNFYAARNVVA